MTDVEVVESNVPYKAARRAKEKGHVFKSIVFHIFIVMDILFI